MTRLAHLLHKHYWPSALLLACLVLRAFVPAGYMIDTDATGGLSIKMCTGLALAAPATDDAPPVTSPGSDGPTGHAGSCPASVPLLALAFAVTLSADVPATAIFTPQLDAPAPTAYALSPSRLPRGPPSIPA